MKLRKKTFLALSTMIIMMGLSIFLTISIFYQSSIKRIERGEAEDAVRSLHFLIADDLHQLDILCRDWAYWDDSYDFALGNNDGYLASNLDGEQTIDLLELSGMLLQDSRQNRLYQFEEKPGLIDRILAAYLATQRAPMQPGMTGLVILESEVHLVAINTILKSDLTGPPQGFIAMARRVDVGQTDRYARILGRYVSIGPAPEDGGFRAGSGGRVNLKLDTQHAQASMDIITMDGQRAARLSLTSQTVSARYGTRLFLAATIIILSIIAITGTLIVLLLEGFLLGRMRAIGKDLDSLVSTKNRKLRLTVAGNDELSALCAAMNGSLDRLDSMIDEREAMLHEINHRVKNNLQMITSMLSLQASSAKSPETLAALERSRHRLQAISVVHDEAFEHPSIEHIDVRSLLERLTSLLVNYGTRTFYPSIMFEGSRVDVDMNTALPVALIASEIVHNVLEHAFPGRDAGELRFHIQKNGTSSLILEIADNGVGLPDLGIRDRGLGLSLVEALVLQLRGSHALTSNPAGGTVFRLEAPLE